MKRLFVSIVTIIIGLNSWASKDSTVVKYAATITVEDLQKHLYIIASDEYAGREAGTEGQKKVAQYIKEHYIKIGIPPLDNTQVLTPIKEGYFQEFILQVSDPSTSKLVLDEEVFEFTNEFFFLDAPNASQSNIKQITFCGFGVVSPEFNELDGVDLKDKFVMIIDDLPTNKKGTPIVDGIEYSESFFERMKNRKEQLNEREVAGALIVLRDLDTKAKAFSMFLKGGRTTLYGGEKEGVAMVFISEALANDILKAQGTSLTKLEKRIIKKKEVTNIIVPTNIKIELGDGVRTPTSENVLGFIEGSDLKDEIVVITAHMDHIGSKGDEIFNGADDDGSGTVALLELAEAFMKAKNEGYGPRRSILLMPVSAEEKGLLGSRYYTDEPVFPLENTVVDLNIDMIGRYDEAHEDNWNYVYLIGTDRLSIELHEISENANKTYTQLELDYTFNDPEDPNRFYYRSDHYNFAKNNIPVIFYFSGVHEDYHKSTDTVDKIKFDILQKRAQLVFYTAWELANRDGRIKVDVVE